MAKKEFVKLMTPKFRASFPSLYQPTSFEGSKPKFEVTMLFDKEYLRTDPKAKELWAKMIAELKRVEQTAFPKGRPANFHFPLRDGDKEKADKDGYAGCFFMKAKTDNKPGIIYFESREAVENPDEVFPGCIMQATINFFSFEKIQKGVSCGLNNLMFYKNESSKVESFSGRANAASDFGDVPVDDAMFDGDTGVQEPAAKSELDDFLM